MKVEINAPLVIPLLLLLSWFTGITRVLAFAGTPTKRYGSPSPRGSSADARSDDRPQVAIIGGGISGLVVGYVLSQSGKYNVALLEQSSVLGGNIRSVPAPDPRDSGGATRRSTTSKNSDGSNTKRLNIGHASHMGMIWNLRLMLRHLGIDEYRVQMKFTSVDIRLLE